MATTQSWFEPALLKETVSSLVAELPLFLITRNSCQAMAFVAGVPAILRHASAQLWHALAHFWQWSNGCFWHSSPHDLQMVAHKSQMALACSLSRAIAATARAQMSTQSIFNAMHCAIIFTSGSCRHEVVHWLQATMQALHASMQALNLWSIIKNLLGERTNELTLNGRSSCQRLASAPCNETRFDLYSLLHLRYAKYVRWPTPNRAAVPRRYGARLGGGIQSASDTTRLWRGGMEAVLSPGFKHRHRYSIAQIKAALPR